MTNYTSFILLLVSFFFSTEAASKIEVSKVKITSKNGMTINTKEKKGTFRGNVQLKLDDLSVNCDILRVEYSEEGDKASIKSVRGTGSVSVYDAQRDIRATGDTLEYTEATGIMTLRKKGGAQVIQKGNKVVAPVIHINLEAGIVEVEGGSSVDINLDELRTKN